MFSVLFGISTNCAQKSSRTLHVFTSAGEEEIVNKAFRLQCSTEMKGKFSIGSSYGVEEKCIKRKGHWSRKSIEDHKVLARNVCAALKCPVPSSFQISSLSISPMLMVTVAHVICCGLLLQCCVRAGFLRGSRCHIYPALCSSCDELELCSFREFDV